MKKIRVAINGAGRIGRAFIRASKKEKNIEIVAVNDLGDIENIAYLLKYDTVYGRAPFSVEVSSDKKGLVLDGETISFVSEKEPAKLPWKDLDIDVVVESTGFFTKFDDARAHITAGAKRVVISAPAKDDPNGEMEATVLMGINEEKLKTCDVTSNASCTTNAVSPVTQILHEAIGIEKALLNTTHSYTASQSIVDGPKGKDFKEGRAAAQNMIPTSTGAAKALTKVVTDLSGKFDGISIRVPTPAGSIADITFIAKRDTTVEEVNEILKKASKEDRWKGIFAVTEDLIVSSDIVGSEYGAIADLGLTRVVGGNLVKVMSWYDNEMGYTNTLVKHVLEIGKHVR